MIAERWAKHVNPEFVKLLGVFGYGRVFVRALGTRLWDDQGREYLDALAGFGSMNLGHSHPRLVRRLQEFLGSGVPNLNHVGPSPQAADLAADLAGRTGLDIALFASSGAEAVEAGLKLARAATGRPGFLSCEGGFHGTNLGNLSVMEDKRWRAPFEPLLSGCVRIPFGDLGRLEAELRTGKYAAFLAEPLQAEGGVVSAPPGYLAAAKELCTKHGTALIFDEVQTGIGRTGAMFAFQKIGVKPDVLVLGKALGGGMTPISVAMVGADLHRRAYGAMDRFDLHSSTFAGNAMGCVTASETLAIVDAEDLAGNASRMGARLLDGLRAGLQGHPFVREIRGEGLLVGVEIGPTGDGWLDRAKAPVVRKISREVFGQWAAVRLLERGIVAQPASHRWEVLRIEPPLVIDEGEVDRIVSEVVGLLGEYDSLPVLMRDVTARLGEQWSSGWQFR